jgi:hypothetical protein
MSDTLARARRFRSRAHEFDQLAATCGSARHSRHYHLIAKHFIALAHIEEEQILAPSKASRPIVRNGAPGQHQAKAARFD